MSKIINIDKTEFKTANQATSEAIESLVSGDFENCNKVLVLGIDDTDPDEVSLSYVRGGMTEAEMVVMLEAFKSKIMYGLGF